jgi:HEAT repeat protein
VIPDLIECLTDGEIFVRFEAATALGSMGPVAKDAVPRLVELLKDENPKVRDAAASALKRIDPAALAKKDE